jgi:hypothetical protein
MLYRAGAIAAIAVIALVPLQMAVYVTHPPPTEVREWFALFARNRLVGLIDLDLLMIIDNVLIGTMFAAVAVALRSKKVLVGAALVVELVAITTYFSSNVSFEMMALSQKYATASDVDRIALVGAGHATLVRWEGSAFNTSYVLGAIAILMISIAMLETTVFSRATAWVGVLFGALSVVPASAGKLGLVMSIGSLIPMWIWLVLIAKTLLRHDLEKKL